MRRAHRKNVRPVSGTSRTTDILHSLSGHHVTARVCLATFSGTSQWPSVGSRFRNSKKGPSIYALLLLSESRHRPLSLMKSTLKGSTQ